VGFDWPDASGVRAKIEEELRETDAATILARQGSEDRSAEELGDLLFAVANWSRHLGVDPEEATGGWGEPQVRTTLPRHGRARPAALAETG